MGAVIEMDWFALIIVAIGTMLLFGEILVKVRGIFGILGFLTIMFYFYSFGSEQASFVTMFIVYIIGISLLVIDGKFLGDGSLALFGILTIIFSVTFTASSFTAGLYASIGVILGIGVAFSFLKLFPSREMWTKLTLKSRLTKEAGYTSLTDEYAQLKGKTGRTITDLRPVGTVKIDNKQYSVVSEGQWIKKHTEVIVVAVDGTKIIFEPKDV